MNKFRGLIFTLIFLLYSTKAYSQFSDSDLSDVTGVTIGLDKNNIGWMDYGFGSGFHLNVKHTLSLRDLSEQNWRIGVSYDKVFKYICASFSPFITSDWKTTFATFGGSFKISSLWKQDLFKLGIEYIPYYDTAMKFQNGWTIAAQAKIHRDVSILGEYGKKQDFRVAYKCVYVGFEVKVLNLCIKPLLQIPIHYSGMMLAQSQVLVCAYYTLH